MKTAIIQLKARFSTMTFVDKLYLLLFIAIICFELYAGAKSATHNRFHTDDVYTKPSIQQVAAGKKLN